MSSTTRVYGRILEIKRHLGPPAWESDGLVLYRGNCLELLDGMPADSVSLTITSPPYNIGKEYERPMPLADYLDWSERWISKVHRVTAPRGAFWLNLGYVQVSGRARAIPLPYLLWSRIPFFLIQEIVWNYGAGVAARRMFSPRNEKWLWYVKDNSDYAFNLDAVRDPNVKYPKQRKNGRLRVNQAGKNPTDVWAIPKVTTGEGRTGRRASPERTAHPAQFPLAVVKRIALACSNAGEMLLDPFAGSSTTLVAALATGRECVGFEINPRYVEVSKRRLQHALRLREAGQLSWLGEDVG